MLLKREYVQHNNLENLKKEYQEIGLSKKVECMAFGTRDAADLSVGSEKWRGFQSRTLGTVCRPGKSAAKSSNVLLTRTVAPATPRVIQENPAPCSTYFGELFGPVGSLSHLRFVPLHCYPASLDRLFLSKEGRSLPTVV